MRQTIFGFLFFVGMIQPIQAQNRTVMTDLATLTAIHLFAKSMPDHETVSGAKFGLQFAEGIYHPAPEALILGLQHVYFGDKTAMGSSISMANRAVAEGYADYFNSTKTKGYLAAALLNGISLLILERNHGEIASFIQDWTIPGALVNSFNHHLLVRGYAPEVAGLLTSVATGVVAVSSGNQHFKTTFVAETGFRLQPSLASMLVSHANIKTVVNIAGMFLTVRATQMEPGHFRTFTGSTGVAFLIGAVIDMIERLKRGVTALEG